MGQRIRDVAIIVLRCVIFGCCASAQQAAFGTGMATPPKSAAGGGYVLIAQADTPVEPQAIEQETKNADAPAEPQAVRREIKSATRLSGSKQRRRKPKMASVPAGPQAVIAAQESGQPATQAAVQETKGAGAPAKPQAVAQETGEDATVAPQKPQAAVQETKEIGAQTEVQETKPEQGGGKRYGMAPIRWGARVSETIRWLSNSTTTNTIPSYTTKTSSMMSVQTAEIKASSYIMQPYIAQVSGGVGVMNGTGSTSNMSNTSSDRNSSLFGNGALSLFPRSRFPFGMSFDSSDSRASSEWTSNDTLSRSLSLQQQYRPPTGYSRYSGNYIRNTSSSKLSGESARSSLLGNYSTILGKEKDQKLNADVTFTGSKDTLNTGMAGNTTNLTMLRAKHVYLPVDSLLSLSNEASITESKQFSQSAGGSNLRARYLQVNTYANWQPEDESLPLFVNGNGYLFTATTQGAAASQSLGGSIAASYLASSNLKYTASGSIAKASRGRMTTTEGAGAYYSSNAVSLRNNATYRWNANGNIVNETGVNSGLAVSGTIGHNLGALHQINLLGKKPSLSSGISQSVTVISDRRKGGVSEVLTNSARASLSYGQSRELTSQVSVNVTDVHIMGGNNPRNYQTISMLATGTSGAGYTGDGFTADATLEATSRTDGGTALIAKGVISYKKPNLFGVRRLKYSADLTLQPYLMGQNNVAGQGNLRNSKMPYTLDQRINYKIGQNELLLNGYLSDMAGVKSASLLLLFRVWRTVGN